MTKGASEQAVGRRQRLAYWVLSIAIISLSCFIAWRMMRPTLVRDAVRHLHAYLGGDGSKLLEAATPEEISGCGLTAKNLDEVMTKLVLPRLNKVRLMGDERVELFNKTGDEAVASESCRFPDGATENLSVDMWFTESGGRRAVLMQCLYTAWYVEKRAATSHPLSTVERLEGYLEGLRKDRSTLQSLGLKGVYWPEYGVTPWDRVDSGIVKQIEQTKQALAKS